MKTNQKPSSNQMTPRGSDGKRFAIRGTTKTVIEVTTTEVDEEIPFRVEDTSGRLGQRTFDHYQDESTRDKKEKEVQNEMKMFSIMIRLELLYITQSALYKKFDRDNNHSYLLDLR